MAVKYVVLSMCVLLAAVVVNEMFPEYIDTMITHPTFRQTTHTVRRFLRDLWGTEMGKSEKTRNLKKERLFTPDELKKYNGQDGSKGLCLSILGRVYNVKKGKQHYGPGGGYEFFAGRDATRAFVSGDFTEVGLIDDISGLSSQDLVGIDDWVKFYEKDYKFVGKLIGTYYDDKGELTKYGIQALQWISEAHAHNSMEDQEKKMFPPCNSEWSAKDGSRVWCTTKSGGIERDWVGVPRKLYNPGLGKARCACIKNNGPPSHDPTRESHKNRGDLDNPNLQEYVDCHPDQLSCTIKESN